MLPKKVLSADLERRRMMFYEVGLLFALLLSFGAFERNFKEAQSEDLYTDRSVIDAPIEIIQTSQPEAAKPEVKPIAIQSDVLKIVTNDVKLNNDFVGLDAEPTDAPVSIMVFPQAPADEIIEDPDEPFVTAETMPTFGKGGLAEFQKFVFANVVYDETAIANRVFGTVIAEFIVNKDGSVSDVKILRGIDKTLDNEVVRAIRKSPKWTPGYQRDKAVRVKFTLPVAFKLN